MVNRKCIFYFVILCNILCNNLHLCLHLLRRLLLRCKPLSKYAARPWSANLHLTQPRINSTETKNQTSNQCEYSPHEHRTILSINYHCFLYTSSVGLSFLFTVLHRYRTGYIPWEYHATDANENKFVEIPQWQNDDCPSLKRFISVTAPVTGFNTLTLQLSVHIASVSVYQLWFLNRHCNCNWGTCIAPPTRRPRAHHRVNPYSAFPIQESHNSTEDLEMWRWNGMGWERIC